jgi:Fe-S cluster biogenesis protein NfuA
VTVKLQGACSTCSSSKVTLKSGVENMLMHYVPEVTCHAPMPQHCRAPPRTKSWLI